MFFKLCVCLNCMEGGESFFTVQYYNSTISKKRPRSELLPVGECKKKGKLQSGAQEDKSAFPETSKMVETGFSMLKPWYPAGNPSLVSNRNISYDSKELDSSDQSVPSSYLSGSQSGLGPDLTFTPPVGVQMVENVPSQPCFQYYYPYYQSPSYLPIPQIVPPPPSVPIINPIVYDNNIDVGMSDLHYVSSDAFTILNARPRQDIRIPRLSKPLKQRTPSELIPSLLPTQKKTPELIGVKQPERTSDSPSVIVHSNPSNEEDNGDKVFVLGFSWNEVHTPCVSENDIWVKK